MQVIAEGVEDMDQVIELTDMGCEYAQGFFFSKPIDLREFDILRNNNMKTEYIPKIIYPTFEFEDQNLLP
jgi:EAL domain-containing protein (putative c-di-GMP-specific phosphodiesterase class I)